MIVLQSIQWMRDAWELHFRVREGVYVLDDYPVRISHLAFTDDSEVRDALGIVGVELLRHHMRRGAIPPHAMVLDWSRAHRVCERGVDTIQAACVRIDASHLATVGAAISSHF